jgi:hypothetical protein
MRGRLGRSIALFSLVVFPLTFASLWSQLLNATTVSFCRLFIQYECVCDPLKSSNLEEKVPYLSFQRIKTAATMAPSITTDGNSVTITINHSPNGTTNGSVSGKVLPNPQSDPASYGAHHKKFISEGQPTSDEGWLQRAREVSEILAVDAAARDIENKSPRTEVSLLKSAGLLKVLGPKNIGGGGQSWEVGYKVIREVAKGDGSLGMLLGYHLLWSTTANVVGNEEQKERVQNLIIENNYFVGGAFYVCEWSGVY